MQSALVIKGAILSEKATAAAKAGVFNFQIADQARKADVKKSVEKQFSVNVVKINISTFAAKKKRIGQTRNYTYVGGGKKAIVWLQKGQTINLFGAKEEKPKIKKEKEEKKDKK